MAQMKCSPRVPQYTSTSQFQVLYLERRWKYWELCLGCSATVECRCIKSIVCANNRLLLRELFETRPPAVGLVGVLIHESDLSTICANCSSAICRRSLTKQKQKNSLNFHSQVFNFYAWQRFSINHLLSFTLLNTELKLIIFLWKYNLSSPLVERIFLTSAN